MEKVYFCKFSSNSSDLLEMEANGERILGLLTLGLAVSQIMEQEGVGNTFCVQNERPDGKEDNFEM